MIFFSASRLAAYFFASFSRLVSRLTIDVFAMVLSSDQRNGKRKASSSARASSFVLAVVVMAMSMPRSASTWSKSISGKMNCSFTPMLKLPRPSNERAETPRKSRTRGSDTFTKRSRHSYILERRRVTLQDRKSKRLTPVTNAHHVCRLLHQKKKQ